MSAELNNLDTRFNICYNRCKILHFELISQRYNSRIKHILNTQKKIHLNTCVDSNACECENACNDPEVFFENQIGFNFDYIITQRNQPEFTEFDDSESDEEFYLFRVLDKKNLYHWYDAYMTMTNVLRFRVKVKELENENAIEKDEINVVLNPESGEYHLTDCRRCIDQYSGSDTCHCVTAMVNPTKYLEDKYHYWTIQNFLKKVKLCNKPTNFFIKGKLNINI